MARGTRDDIVARVTTELGDGYYGSFHDKGRQVQNVEFRSPDKHSLNAYVERPGPAYEPFMEVLEDGNPQDIAVTTVNITDETRYPLITGFLSRPWQVPG